MYISAKEWLEAYLSDGKFRGLKKLQVDARMRGFTWSIVGGCAERGTGGVPGVEFLGRRLKK